ncbi:MAG: ABC transporter permease [Chryseolinea sp.]
MLRNYIMVAWRTLTKNKLFSAINVFGLSLALALGMVILVHVISILRIDSFHENGDRIYRIISRIKTNDGKEWTLASSPLPLIESFSDDKMLFENSVRIYPAIKEDASVANKVIPIRGAFTGPSFLKLFGFRLKHGDLNTALKNPNDVVLSASTASKFFGDDNALNKIIVLENLGAFKVTGVLQEPKYESHINYDILVAESGIASLEKQGKLPGRLESWQSFESAYTYVLLKQTSKTSNLEDKLSFIAKAINNDSQSGSLTFLPQRLSSITPSWDDVYNEIGSGMTWGKLLGEVGIGFIIVFAACFNYTNLSIARAFSRTKEIGLRKVVGAKRHQVFTQYIIEAMMVAFMSLFFAQIILSVLIEVQLFWGVQLSDFDVATIICIVLFTALVGAMAGAVPAWILSSLKPLKMLRNVMTEKIVIGLTPRKALIVFQFVISLIVVIFMVTFQSQFSYMSDLDPGFRMEGIISIPIENKSYNALMGEISREVGVESVAAVSGNFGRYPTGSVAVRTRSMASQPLNINFFFVDGHALDVSQLSLVSGRNFSEQSPTREHQIILNQKAAEVLGFSTPAEAVGNTILLADSIPVTVIGVIKDFYSEGVGLSFRPLLLRHEAGHFRALQVAVHMPERSETQARLEKIWKRVCPDTPFTYVWLQDEHDERYADMGSIGVLAFLSFMAISIALLGLLGLLTYTAETRKKEISIRKVIGANAHQIMLLLSKGFVKLLLVSGCIALPISYLAGEMFLTNFANRTSVGVLNPLLCFSSLVCICLVMMLLQTFAAAAENPARNLKSE